MPRNGRPPMKAAEEAADQALRFEYQDAWVLYRDRYLAEHGWEQKEVTVTKWVNGSEAAASEGDD